MATLSPLPKMQFFDNNGDPLVAGKLYSYSAGTTTPKVTYTDYTGTIANTNPVILDSAGRSNIWLSGNYKLILKTSADVEIWTVDNVSGLSGNLPQWLTVTGTNTIFATSTDPITAYVAQQNFYFFAAGVNTGATTININGLGAKSIKKNGSSDLVSGDLPAGSFVHIAYDGTNFQLILEQQSDYIIKTGMVLPYAGSSAPSGYLLCGGQAISRTTYAALFAVISTTYGAGDGSTTFNVPDINGRFIFGLDNMGGSAANRITTAGCGINGTTLGASGGSQFLATHNHTGSASTTSLTGSVTASLNTTAFSTATGILTVSNNTGKIGGGVGTNDNSTFNLDASHTHTITVNNAGTGSSANVPPAIGLNLIIKY